MRADRRNEADEDFVGRLCKEQGLSLKVHNEWHWQILGGVKPVNLHWNKDGGLKVYMSGQTHSVFMSIQDSIRLAKEGIASSVPAKAGKGSIGKKRRKMLRNHPRCKWCDEPLNDETATVDHIVPRAQGGSNRNDNLCLACPRCQDERGSKAVNPAPFDRAPTDSDLDRVDRIDPILL